MLESQVSFHSLLAHFSPLNLGNKGLSSKASKAVLKDCTKKKKKKRKQKTNAKTLHVLVNFYALGIIAAME